MNDQIRQKFRRFFEQPWIALGIVVILIILFFTESIIVDRNISSQFRVIYSLDERHNDREIVSLIDDADEYIYFAIYYFNRSSIAEALVRAKKRGLIVWGIMDAEASLDANKNIAFELRSASIPLETQRHQDGIMHMKVLVTDKAYASGSYNWTSSATNVNDEVLEIGTNKSVRRRYLEIVQKVLLANQ